jgi:hypothetical protein
MPCALTTDYTFATCIGGQGGAQKVFITEWANLSGAGSTFTATAGVITAWTLATGKKFRTYSVDQEQVLFTDPLAVSDETGAIVYTPTVAFTIKGFSITNFLEIALIAKNYLCIIVLDNNGLYWVYGKDRPMKMVSASADGGQKLEDGQKQLLSFNGKDSVHMYQMNAALITALTA